MRTKRIFWEGSWILIVLAGLFLLEKRGVRRCADYHEATTALRITRLAAYLIGRAHQTKDDLLLQETVQAVSWVPGVSFASVSDSHKKILAHSDPSKLGQPLRLRLGHGVEIYSLEEGKEEWGNFAFKFLDPHFEGFMVKSFLPRTGFLLLAAIGIFGFLMKTERKNEACLDRMKDLTALLQDQKNETSRLAELSQQVSECGHIWLGLILGKLNCPALFLDGQQRVMALNQGAISLLQPGSQDSLKGKSWNETKLSALGFSLEQSLLRPGQSIAAFFENIPCLLESVQSSEKHERGTLILFERTLNQ